jgi:hypothetical protein
MQERSLKYAPEIPISVLYCLVFNDALPGKPGVFSEESVDCMLSPEIGIDRGQFHVEIDHPGQPLNLRLRNGNGLLKNLIGQIEIDGQTFVLLVKKAEVHSDGPIRAEVHLSGQIRSTEEILG